MDNKKKLKRVLIVMGIVSILLVAFVLYFGRKGFTKEGRDNKKNEDNINYIYNYISQNLNGNLPYPRGDLILLDKDFKQIYLENKNNYSDDFSDVYVIQGNTCGLDLTDQTRKYDVRFSNDKSKRCYEYAITKDKKYFQLGRIEKGFFGYESKVKGNTKMNLLRDYASDTFVKDGDSKHFVSFPGNNDNLQFQIVQGNPDVKLEINDEEYKDFSKSGLKDGVFLGGGKTVGIYMQGDNFLTKVIFPNGGYIFLAPINGKAELYVRKVGLDENKSALVMKNFKGIMWANFPTPSQYSDSRIYDNYGGSYILDANRSFFYSSGDVFASLVMQGSLEFIQKMQTYFFQKGFLNATNKEKIVNLENEDLQEGLKQISAFGIKLNQYNNINNTVQVSQGENQKNSMINYLASKNIKQSDAFDLSLNGNKYKIIRFSGVLDKEFAKNIKTFIQKNDVSNLNIDGLLDKVCGDKNQKISMDEFVSFFDSYEEKTKSLDFDKNLSNILSNKNIIIGDKSSQMWSLGYWDGEKKTFGYIPDLMEPSKDIKDFVLVCKIK